MRPESGHSKKAAFLGGLEMIVLPADFSWIGPAAFELGCRRWTSPRTGIQEIVEGCPQLQCLKLTKTLRRIGREVFLKCSSLEVMHTPQLCKLVRMGKKGTWSGTYVEHNTFEMCTKFSLPSWIRSLPKPDAAKESDDEHDTERTWSHSYAEPAFSTLTNMRVAQA